MGRYFFDFRDAETFIPDEEGVEIATLEAAQDETARALGDMARDEARCAARNGSACDLAIEVRDAHGPVFLARISFEIRRLH